MSEDISIRIQAGPSPILMFNDKQIEFNTDYGFTCKDKVGREYASIDKTFSRELAEFKDTSEKYRAVILTSILKALAVEKDLLQQFINLDYEFMRIRSFIEDSLVFNGLPQIGKCKSLQDLASKCESYSDASDTAIRVAEGCHALNLVAMQILLACDYNEVAGYMCSMHSIKSGEEVEEWLLAVPRHIGIANEHYNFDKASSLYRASNNKDCEVIK